MKHSFLMLVASKDTLVDNTAARKFYSKVSTPATKKQMNQLICFHEMHKDMEVSERFYTTIYKYIAKVMSEPDSPKNWPLLKKDDFKVGRTANSYYPPVKTFIACVALFLYFITGILIYIGTRIFSSRPKAYQFANVVLRWPRAFFQIFSVLKT